MRVLVTAGGAVLLSAALVGAAAAGGSPRARRARSAGLTLAQIEKPSTDSWPTYNGDYSGRRFSSLTKINAANVKNI